MRRTSAVEDLLRSQAPQVLGAPVRRYGHVDPAADTVREALHNAARQWPEQGTNNRSLAVPAPPRPAAGAAGLLVGFGVPEIGTAAAVGLALFSVGAIAVHLRAHDHGYWLPGLFLPPAVASLVLGVAHRGPW